MANPWFVEIPANAVGETDAQLEQVDFRTNAWAVGSPQYNALMAGKAIQDFGMSMVKWKGPFATEAEAKAAQNPQPSPNTPGQIAGQVTSQATHAVGSQVLSDIFGGQAPILVRIGQILLGLVLVAVGVARITHAIPVATKVAKTVGAVAV